jgi:hypothetical protein
MMTMFNPMMRSPCRNAPRIIGALLLASALLLQAGCSVLRTLGYHQAPNLVYWRLDRYLGFDDEQAPRVRDAIADWFRWHRSTQLPGYVEFVARVRAQLAGPATPALACRWWDELRDHLDTALEQAAHRLAPVALTLKPAQLAHLERRYAKSLDEMRRDHLQESAEERRRAALQRTIERFEAFYGRLDEAQRKRVAAAVEASPFDAERFIAERKARHEDTLVVLRRLTAEPRTSLAQAEAALRELAQQTLRSPRPAYRAYQRELLDYNCAFVAQMHDTMSAKQRQSARDMLGAWETDLRSWLDGS